MQACLLSKRGAKNIVEHIENKKFISRPIDTEIYRSWEVGNPAYAIFPQPILEFNIPTTIHTAEQVKERKDSSIELDLVRKNQSIQEKIRIKFSNIVDRFYKKRHEYFMSASDNNTARKAHQFFSDPTFSQFQKR